MINIYLTTPKYRSEFLNRHRTRFTLLPVLFFTFTMSVIIFISWVPLIAESYTTTACDPYDLDPETAIQCQWMLERREEMKKPLWSDWCQVFECK